MNRSWFVNLVLLQMFPMHILSHFHTPIPIKKRTWKLRAKRCIKRRNQSFSTLPHTGITYRNPKMYQCPSPRLKYQWAGVKIPLSIMSFKVPKKCKCQVRAENHWYTQPSSQTLLFLVSGSTPSLTARIIFKITPFCSHLLCHRKKFTNFELEDSKQVPIIKDILTYLTFSFPILRIFSIGLQKQLHQ